MLTDLTQQELPAVAGKASSGFLTHLGQFNYRLLKRIKQ
ncbi:hypothetical protein EV11_1699 [Prochlorococcus sp. SS52]|nr:hypothetical protein EV11_1699 [Prochlorococcus sp. SS52]